MQKQLWLVCEVSAHHCRLVGVYTALSGDEALELARQEHGRSRVWNWIPVQALEEDLKRMASFLGHAGE